LYIFVYGTIAHPDIIVGIYAQVPPNASAQWTINAQADSAQLTMTDGADKSPLSPAFSLQALRQERRGAGNGAATLSQLRIAGQQATCFSDVQSDLCIVSKGILAQLRIERSAGVRLAKFRSGITDAELHEQPRPPCQLPRFCSNVLQ